MRTTLFYPLATLAGMSIASKSHTFLNVPASLEDRGYMTEEEVEAGRFPDEAVERELLNDYEFDKYWKLKAVETLSQELKVAFIKVL